MMRPEVAAAIRDCADLVRTADPDRFAATMAAPAPLRDRLWPLYAYNIEIARVPHAVSEPLLAEIRLQWWADTVAGLGVGAAPTGAGVVLALDDLLRRVAMPARLLEEMAEARGAELDAVPCPDVASLWLMLDRTAGNLMWAASLALGAPATAEPVVREFAAAAGLAAWFRAVPELRARGRSPLPDETADAIAALAAEGLARITRARSRRYLVPPAAIPALWPGFPARSVLRQALRAPERVLDAAPAVSEFTRRGGLLLRAMTGYW